MRLFRFGSSLVAVLTVALFLSSPITTLAQDATPSPSPTTGGPNATFLDMLSVAPDILNASEPPQSEIAEFADVSLQLAATGARSPDSADDPALALWLRATRWLALPQDLASRAFDPSWRQVFGFDVFHVDQSLVVGEPPYTLTILRGRFDQNEVIGALTNSGYNAVDVEGLQAYSLFEDASVDLQNPVSQLALSRMNNAVFLPDGTLAFATTLDGIREIVAVAQGNASSLADRLDIAALVPSIPRPLASALLLRGGSLQLSGMLLGFSASPGQVQELVQQIEQLGTMPPITMALFGVSAGGPLPEALGEGTPEATPVPEDIEPAVFEIGLLTLVPGNARTAEETVVARIGALNSTRTEQPYGEMFTSVTPAGPAELPVAVLELTFSDETLPSIWLNMIFSRDLLFVGW
jgi:hypothetical protein